MRRTMILSAHLAALSLLGMGRLEPATTNAVEEEPAITNAVEEPPPPPPESRQVRRQRERRLAKLEGRL